MYAQTFNNMHSVLINLYNWLQSLQIDIPNPRLKRIDNQWCVTYHHPILNQITCVLPNTQDKYLMLEGIGFEITYQDNVPNQINCYDQGAIFDPIDFRVEGDHYATSHFALLCANLFALEKDKKYINNISLALSFSDRIKDGYKFSVWGPHWEFDNFAWSEVYEILKNENIPELARNLYLFLKNPPQHRLPFATNWKLLAVNYLEKQYHKNVVDKAYDLIKKIVYYYFIEKSFLDDGCIEDVPRKSRSVQYHAFSSALVAYLYKNKRKKKHLHKIIKSITYLDSFIDPEGMVNYKGRGQNQIFCYAPAVYLFLFGRELFENGAQSEYFKSKAKLIFSKLARHQGSDGYFPLVFNGIDDDKKVGWYSYNHITVYNAFIGSWLGLALNQFGDFQSREKIKNNDGKYRQDVEKHPITTYHANSNVYIYKSKDMFFCVSQGEDLYETECGFVFHHLFIRNFGAIISCPGGPDIGDYGWYRTEIMPFNYFAPIIIRKKEIINPGNKTCYSFSKENDDIIKMKMRYSEFIDIHRKIVPGEKSLIIQDRVFCHINPDCDLIGFNIPIMMNRKNVHLNDDSSISIKNNVGGQIDISLKCDADFSITQRAGETSAGKIVVVQSTPITLKQDMTIELSQHWSIQNN